MTAIALVVASMIGTGVFTTSGFSLAGLGNREFVMLAWCVAGLLAMAGALSYGALARRIPHSGGEYTFLSYTIHPLVGFLAGWVSLLAGFTGPIAIAALALQAYLAPTPEGGPEPLPWIGTGAILLAALIHGIRLGPGVVAQNFAVLAKLVLIVCFVVLGAIWLPGSAAGSSEAPASFDLGGFAVAVMWISFSYSGWNAAVYVASEVKDPERNLNRSLWIATALVTVLYLALNAVFVYSAPIADLAGKKEVGAIAAEAIGGPVLRSAVSALVALALFTSISAMVMIGPRVYSRMAEDGLFPRWLRFRGQVPYASILFQAALAVVVVWMTTLRDLIEYLSFTLGVSAAVTVIGLISLRIREGAERVPVPGFPWLPGIFVVTVLGSAGFMVYRADSGAYIGILTIAVGVPLYFIMRWIGRRREGTNSLTRS